VRRLPWPGTTAAQLLALAAALACLSAAPPTQAQRQPVLKQIDVPHPYYFREMYLPQLTSGPSAVAFSPDGRTLVYSMQGSLWKQDIDSTQAEELVAGPGYDFQPDWSADGRHIAFVRYRDDALELMELDRMGRELPGCPPSGRDTFMFSLAMWVPMDSAATRCGPNAEAASHATITVHSITRSVPLGLRTVRNSSTSAIPKLFTARETFGAVASPQALRHAR